MWNVYGGLDMDDIAMGKRALVGPDADHSVAGQPERWYPGGGLKRCNTSLQIYTCMIQRDTKPCIIQVITMAMSIPSAE